MSSPRGAPGSNPGAPSSSSPYVIRLRVRFHERTRLEHVEDRDEFVARNLPRLVAQLEATIRAHPDQWEGWGEFDRMIAPRELGPERSTDA